MDGPHVVRVDRDGGQAGVLGGLVVAGLLQPEGLHAPHEGGVRVGRVERSQRASGPVAEVGRVAPEEVERVACPHGQHVGGPAFEQLVEDAGGAVPVAAGPRPYGGVVGPPRGPMGVPAMACHATWTTSTSARPVVVRYR